MAVAEAPTVPTLTVSVTPRHLSVARPRLDYLDALKVGLTALVIAHHPGQPYGPTGGRWPIFDPEQASILGPFFAVNAAFFMGLFFLISAYFVPASFDRKGGRRFLADRALRLGIPLVSIGLLIGALDGQRFDPAHLWFVAHLLVYAVLYTLVRTMRIRGFRAIPVPTHRAILGYAVGLSIVTAAVRVAGFPQDRWVSVLGVLPIEMAHLPQYASLFVIGLLAARTDWLSALPRRTGLTWLGIGLALAALRYVWALVAQSSPNVLLWSAWESLLCIGMCVGLPILLRDFGHPLTARLRKLAPNAYGAYVLHVMPVVVGLQFALVHVDVDPFVKFVLVTGAGVPLSFWLADLARRISRARKRFCSCSPTVSHGRPSHCEKQNWSVSASGVSQPVWVRWLLAMCVVIIAALTLSLSSCWCSSGQWITRLALVSVVLASFCVELAFGILPRWVLALLVGVPVAWLIVSDNASVAPLFLLAMVGWIVFTGTLRDAVFAVALAIVAVLGYVRFDTPERWLPWIAGLAATGLFMRMLVAQRQLVHDLRAAQADLARQAVANERRRIAGEIHDIAAHALAVTILHLTGARMRLQREGGHPELVESLTQAERLGRQSLDDVRRTVGLLREEPSSGTLPPLPGAADVDNLVAEYRSAGLEVDLQTHGSVADVSPAAGLALYRVIQESLANAVKHAPGARVSVCVEVNSDVHVRVSNPLTRTAPTGGGGASGHGLEGMRERVLLLGGTLRAGPAQDGWLVECTLPEGAH